MNQKTKTILKSFFILVLFAFSIRALAVWTNPTAAPAGGNATPPINVGTTSQQKDGIFASNGFRSFGSTRLDTYVGIGTDATSTYMLDVAGNVKLGTSADEVFIPGGGTLDNGLLVRTGGLIVSSGDILNTGNLLLSNGADRTIKITDRTTNGAGNSLTISAGNARDTSGKSYVGGNLILTGGTAPDGDIGNVLVANNGGKLCLGDTNSCIATWSEISGSTGSSQWTSITGGINYAA
jgi:hypothetical protein